MNVALVELLDDLAYVGLTPADVRWVGNETSAVTWAEFVALVEQDNCERPLHSDLLVVGDDWWLEQVLYDGRGWWTLKRVPTRPHTHGLDDLWWREPTSLKGTTMRARFTPVAPNEEGLS